MNCCHVVQIRLKEVNVRKRGSSTAGLTWGMFRSSTKMTAFLPLGGPYTPLRRLSIFASAGRIMVHQHSAAVEHALRQTAQPPCRGRAGTDQSGDCMPSAGHSCNMAPSSLSIPLCHPPMMSCVWLALVRAEKVSMMGCTSGGIAFSSLLATVSVLPVPVSPTHKMCLPAASSTSSR